MEKKGNQNRIFYSLYAITIIDTIIGFLLYSFLPDFLNDVTTNKQVWLSILFLIFIGCQMISGPILGYIGDQYGRRPVFILATIATCFSQLSLIPRTLSGIVINRFSDGLTNGLYATTRSAIVDISTTEQAPKRLGVIEAVSSIGIILGPAVSAVLLFFLLPRGLETTTIIIATSISLSLLNIVIALSIPETNKNAQKHFRINDFVKSIVQQINPFLLWKRIQVLRASSPELARFMTGLFFIGAALGYYAYFIIFLSQGPIHLDTKTINHLMLVLGIIIFMINALFFKFLYHQINALRYFKFAIAIGIILIPAYGIFGTSIERMIILFILDSLTLGLSMSLLNGFVSQKAPSDQQGEVFGLVQGIMSVSGFFTVIVYTVLTAIDIRLPFFWFSFCLMIAYWILFVRKK